MRKPSSLLRSSIAVLCAPLLLAGCVDDTANYQIEDKDHALILRVVQNYFWSKNANLRLIASRMPDCQRQIDMGDVSLPGLEIELFASAPNVYTLRVGEDVWQVDTQTCTELEAPEAGAVTGQALGSFHLNEQEELVFEAAGMAPAAE